MYYTPNYHLPIYEAEDYANYLDTYNNTIKELDKQIFLISERVKNGELDINSAEQEIAEIKTKISTLETEITTLTENVTHLSNKSTSQGEQITKITEDLLSQNALVKQLSEKVGTLSEEFENFKTSQKLFNDTITAKVGNRFIEAHTYNIANSVTNAQYTDEFTVETGLINGDDFAKSTLILQAMQTNADVKMAEFMLVVNFSSAPKTFNFTADNIRYQVVVAFNVSAGSISIIITGEKQATSGMLYVNTNVYTN